MRKANLKAKVTQKFAKWLEVGANVSGNYMKNDQIPGSNIGSSILERLIHQRPIDHVYTPGGGYYTGGTPQLTFHNPVQILDEQIAYIENYRILGNFFAKFNLFDDKLQIQANYNADLSFTYDYTYYNENHPYGTGVGRLVEAYRHVPNTTFEVYANYNDKFGDVDFSAMLGHSYQEVTASRTMSTCADSPRRRSTSSMPLRNSTTLPERSTNTQWNPISDVSPRATKTATCSPQHCARTVHRNSPPRTAGAGFPPFHSDGTSATNPSWRIRAST